MDHAVQKFANRYNPHRQHFDQRMNDLKEQFGAIKFSDARCNQIYEIVKDRDRKCIDYIFDEFIGNAKFAPVKEDFLKQIAIYRETAWAEVKREEREEVAKFFTGEMGQRFLSSLAKTVQMPDEERNEKLDEFISYLEREMKLRPAEFSGCKECNNSGVIYYTKKNKMANDVGYLYSKPCRCDYGDQYRSSWSGYGKS